MHLEAPLTCAVCQKQSAFVTRCPDCDVPLRDARGRVAPVPPRPIPQLDAVAGLAAAGGWAAATLVTTVLGRAIPALMPLMVVPMLVPVVGTAVAAWRNRRAASGPARDSMDAHARELGRLEKTSASRIGDLIRARGGDRVVVRGELVEVPAASRDIGGVPPRFAVTDGTGVALVDDDSLVLWAADRGAPHHRLDELPRHGRVVVVGRARTATCEETRLAWHGEAEGYRETSAVLAFDGDVESPTLALVTEA